MIKPKKKNILSNRPATKGDIEQLREDFQSDLVNHTHSKKEINEKFVAFKEEIIQELSKKTDQDKQEIIHELKAAIEHREEELESAHQDQLDVVAGKQSAPPQWRSMPRRLKTVEDEVVKIKDHLEIP